MQAGILRHGASNPAESGGEAPDVQRRTRRKNRRGRGARRKRRGGAGRPDCAGMLPAGASRHRAASRHSFSVMTCPSQCRLLARAIKAAVRPGKVRRVHLDKGAPRLVVFRSWQAPCLGVPVQDDHDLAEHHGGLPFPEHPAAARQPLARPPVVLCPDAAPPGIHAAPTPYLSITAVIVPKCRRAPSCGLVTIGATMYSSLMRAGSMSSNSSAFMTDAME